VLYAVTIVLILLLVTASCVALLLGVLGEMGVLRYLRCERCEHLVVAPRDGAAPTCLYCRHVHLTHPVRTLRHPIRELIR
jgi:hypothetical protein